MMTFVMLASGEILSERSALAATLENTGAATCPPKYLPLLGSSIITAMMMRGSEAGASPTNEPTYFLT